MPNSMTEFRYQCQSCRGLRSLELHLHELSLFCNLFDNTRSTVIGGSSLNDSKLATTNGVSKWVLLASQIDQVIMDASRFEVAQLYCEPVWEAQKSDAEHQGSLATRITRFLYLANALEELYRFCSPTYSQIYSALTPNKRPSKRLQSGALKLCKILQERFQQCSPPEDFFHLVKNFSKLIDLYEDYFQRKLERTILDSDDVAYGLDLVRCLRNHIAHGIFPIVENPEYSMSTDAQNRAIKNLLNQATRVGAIYIQLALSIDNDGLKSEIYDQLSSDLDTGPYFVENCTFHYLLSLHRKQEFGLSEESYFNWSERMGGN